MSRADFDSAEALAQQVEKMHVQFHPGEDTPAQVLTEIEAVFGDPKLLLREARVALRVGALDRAESLARRAQKLSGTRPLPRLWGDGPSQVLREIQAARARQRVATKAAARAPLAATAGQTDLEVR
jgi:hypothetical protein